MSSSPTPQTTSASVVMMLPLILIPIVISGFFLVYVLVGPVLEGEHFLRWQTEAWSVALPTLFIQYGVCALIIYYARSKALGWSHALNWMSLSHMGLGSILAAIVYYFSFVITA